MTPLEQPHYGHRVRELRDEKGFTRKGLADAVDVAGNYLTNITCGLDEPSNRLKHVFARVLEAPELAPPIVGIPDPPPKQPKKPSGPPRRQDKEGDKKAPKRAI